MTHDLMVDDICSSTSILECMRSLLNFVYAVRNEASAEVAIGHLYDQIKTGAREGTNSGFEDKQYFVVDGSTAIMEYLRLTMPPMTTPTETIHALRMYAGIQMRYFQESETKAIEKDRVIEILEYLDNRYSLSQKVFNDRKVGFLILNALHFSLDAFYGIYTSPKETLHRIYLYTLPKENDGATVEFTLFHELSHVLHMRLTGNYSDIPEDVLSIMRQTFPQTASSNDKELAEYLADIVANGLMLDSPYAQYRNPNIPCDQTSKKAALLIAQKVIDKL